MHARLAFTGRFRRTLGKVNEGIRVDLLETLNLPVCGRDEGKHVSRSQTTSGKAMFDIDSSILRSALNAGRYSLPLSLGHALEIVSKAHGFNSWNYACAEGAPKDLFKARAHALREALAHATLPLDVAACDILAKDLTAVLGPTGEPEPSISPQDRVKRTLDAAAVQEAAEIRQAYEKVQAGVVGAPIRPVSFALDSFANEESHDFRMDNPNDRCDAARYQFFEQHKSGNATFLREAEKLLRVYPGDLDLRTTVAQEYKRLGRVADAWALSSESYRAIAPAMQAMLQTDKKAHVEWGVLDNRPFFRALYCHSEMLAETEGGSDLKAAIRLSKIGYSLHPNDNVGFRFLHLELLARAGLWPKVISFAAKACGESFHGDALAAAATILNGDAEKGLKLFARLTASNPFGVEVLYHGECVQGWDADNGFTLGSWEEGADALHATPDVFQHPEVLSALRGLGSNILDAQIKWINKAFDPETKKRFGIEPNEEQTQSYVRSMITPQYNAITPLLEKIAAPRRSRKKASQN
jgi:hypothetical protein